MSHLGEKDFTNRLDYIQAQKDLIHKGLYGGLPCEDVIMKGGEGSKGGKVIGHTKSGKPIYENAKHASHREFTSSEHKEAIDFHNLGDGGLVRAGKLFEHVPFLHLNFNKSALS